MMSEAAPRQPKRSRLGCAFKSIGFGILAILALGLVSVEIPFFFLFAFIFVASGFLQIAGYSLIGWCLFLLRIVGDVEWNLSSLTLGIATLIFLIAGTHWAVFAFAPAASWRVSQTASVVLLGGGTCVAAICLVGMGHEITWMLAAKEPWIVVVGSGSEISFRIKSKNNLKQIGLGLANYHDVNDSLPAGGRFQPDGTADHGWMTALLPYIGEQVLYNQINFDRPWYDPANRQPFETRVIAYDSPVESPPRSILREYALAGYAGNDRVLNANHAYGFKGITDGLSNTVIAGEVNHSKRPWGDAANWRSLDLGINQSPLGFGDGTISESVADNKKVRGAHFLLGDGSVRYISDSTAPDVLKALATPDAGDPVTEF